STGRWLRNALVEGVRTRARRCSCFLCRMPHKSLSSGCTLRAETTHTTTHLPAVVSRPKREALMSAIEIDQAKLEAFMGQAVTDMGAIISAPLMLIGEK